MKEFDVTIVGLGPAGGTLANLLAMHDFSILILDREKSFYPLPRAVHFDDEIMRVFQTIGITKEFLKHTIINKGTKFVNSKDKVILDWPRPKKITDNGWYPSYRFHQPDLEKKLRKKLKNYKKVSIEQNSEVTKIINNLKGRRPYEEKRAAKLGFASLYDYFEDKISKKQKVLEEEQKELETRKADDQQKASKKSCSCC